VLHEATSQPIPEHFERNFICFTCHSSLQRGRLPAQSKSNGLNLEVIPNELSNLTTLERHIISRRIAFMKLLSLPRGKQLSIHGPAVNVPTAVVPVMSILPRVATDDSFVPLKLKRKLSYRGHYMYGNINVQRVNSALNWLMSNNNLYADVSVANDWQESWKDNDSENVEDKGNEADVVVDEQQPLLAVDGEDNCEEEVGEEIERNGHHNDSENMEDKGNEGDVVLDEQQPLLAVDGEDNCEEEVGEEIEANGLRGIAYDTCLQEDDDEGKEKIVSVAPGEDQRPLPILEDKFFEELAFPDKFPLGSGGFASQKRRVRLTPRKYFNQRVLDLDGRFAKDTDYLFAAQYAVENKQVRDNVNIMLRQTKGGRIDGRKITASVVRDVNQVSSFVRRDHAFRCLTTIRGSPAYWQRTQLDVLAMIRQLGIPTWFMTLSAADMQWPDVIQTVAHQYGEILSDEQVSNMSWEEKCSYIRRNPVIVARHYDFRLKTFFTEFLKSDANPVGKITYHFYRIEFQQRGSPHVHMLLWVSDAPEFDKDSDREVCEFIDRYQTCCIPDDDEELKNLVLNVQKHSHSKSCRMKDGSCRFSFPKTPCERTIVARGPSSKPIKFAEEVGLVGATEIMKKVQPLLETYLKDDPENIPALSVILERLGVTREMYE